MAWWSSECPVRPREQGWIDDSMRWLRDEFGDDPLAAPMVLPTDEFFPGAYHGSEEDVRGVLDLLCAHMDVAPGRVTLEFYDESSHAAVLSTLPSHDAVPTGATTAGHYQRRDGQTVISIDASQAQRPVSLVATLAHELCHERLIGEDRLDPAAQEDHEPLTDLLTVYLGLGIFSANSSHEFHPHATGWSTRRTGYLTEPMYGYALARYARLRGETRPAWMKHLDTNPRAAMKQGLRHLRVDA